jgi:hypothetical protein
VGQPSDLAGLSRRKWYVMAAGWSLLLLVPAIVALTSDAPLPVRLLQLLAVLGYAACYVFGLYEGRAADRLRSHRRCSSPWRDFSWCWRGSAGGCLA